MPEMKIQIAECIQKECKKRKLTLTKMASLSGVSKSTLHDWGTSGSHPKLDSSGLKNLRKLADYLEVSIPQLLFGMNTDSQPHVLFESTFRDGDHKYKLKIERISDT